MDIANCFCGSIITIIIIMNRNAKIKLFFLLMSMYSLSTKKIKIYSWLKSFSTRVMAFKRRQSIDHFQSCAIGGEKKKE